MEVLPDAGVFAGLGLEVLMVPFFVQIKCQLGKSYEVANRLADAEVVYCGPRGRLIDAAAWCGAAGVHSLRSAPALRFMLSINCSGKSSSCQCQRMVTPCQVVMEQNPRRLLASNRNLCP